MGSLRHVIPFLARGDATSHAAWLMPLRQAMPDFEIIAFADLSPGQRLQAQVAIVANPDPRDIAALPNLIWVQSLWAGVEQLARELPDSNIRPDSNIKIARLIDPQLSQTMAQAVLAWVLYLHRNMPAYAHQQRQHLWQQLPLKAASDTHIGLLGLGQLGKAAAAHLLANNFQVSGWSRSAAQIEGMATFSGADGLVQLLGQADILILLLPLTPDTIGLLDAPKLAQIKRGASLINFARGAIINSHDLIAALDEGHLSHAVLDVFETEPLPSDNALWQHPNITILPHISAPTNKNSASQIVAANLELYFQTGAIPASIDRKKGY